MIKMEVYLVGDVLFNDLKKAEDYLQQLKCQTIMEVIKDDNCAWSPHESINFEELYILASIQLNRPLIKIERRKL